MTKIKQERQNFRNGLCNYHVLDEWCQYPGTSTFEIAGEDPKWLCRYHLRCENKTEGKMIIDESIKQKAFRNYLNNANDLIRDHTFANDEHIKNLEAMEKNMPEMMNYVRGAKTPYEKIMICATALGKPELMEQPVMKMILKKLGEQKD